MPDPKIVVTGPENATGPERDDSIRLPAGFHRQLALAKEMRKREEQIWDVALLFLEGFQNLNLLRSSAKRRYQQGQVDANLAQGAKSQFTFNLCFIPFRHLLSALTVNYPSSSVLPASPAPDDVVKATASEEAAKYYWLQEDMARKFSKASGWLVATGNVALHNVYDVEKGLACGEVVSPYDLLMEKGATDQSESDWTAVRSRPTPAAMKRAYAKVPNASAIMEIIDRTAPRKDDDDDLENRLEVWDVYFKDGRHGVLLEDQWIWGGRQPKGAEVPVQHIVYTKVPGKLYGIGALQNVIDPQIVYNEKSNQVIDGIALRADPKVLLPITAQVPATSFRRKAFEKIPYNPIGGAPAYMQPPSFPPEVFADLQRVEVKITDLFGVHSTSLGKTASNVESGAHVEQLTRNDASQLEHTMDNIECAAEQHTKVALIYMQTYYVEARYVRMFDDTGKFVFSELKGTNLVADPEVFIESKSMFRDGIAARQQKVLSLLQAGALSPQQAAEELALKTANKHLLKRVQALSHAKNLLNTILENGPEVGLELYPTDDFDALEEVFGGFMATENFYTLPPEAQQHLGSVYQTIVDAKQMLAAQAAGGPMQAPQRGRPTGPGTGHHTAPPNAVMGGAYEGADEMAQREVPNAG